VKSEPSLVELVAEPAKALEVPIEAAIKLLAMMSPVQQNLLVAVASARHSKNGDEARWVTKEEAAALLHVEPRWLMDHKREFVYDRPGGGRFIRFRVVGNDVERADR
jgi:hypothetical protein